MITHNLRAILPTTAPCLASGKLCRRHAAMRPMRHRKLPRSTWRGGSLPPGRIVPGEGVPNFRRVAIGAHPLLCAPYHRRNGRNAPGKTKGAQDG